MLNYAMLSAAVVMFGAQFYINGNYEKRCGNSLRAAVLFSFGTSVCGFIALLIINKFRFEFTVFTLLMSLWNVVNMLLFFFFSLKAFSKINLSVYSVFSMLGGMALPSAVGLLFYGEKLSFGKVFCFLCICAALALTVEKGESKKGYIWYAGIFILNGMSGVTSKIFTDAPYAKTSAAGFSVLSSLLGAVVSLLLLLVIKDAAVKLDFRAVIDMVGYGTGNKIANYLLLLALESLPASVQYPFITGGVMIVSTVLCYFTPQKPTKREWAAVALSFIGVVLMTLADTYSF